MEVGGFLFMRIVPRLAQNSHSSDVRVLCGTGFLVADGQLDWPLFLLCQARQAMAGKEATGMSGGHSAVAKISQMVVPAGAWAI
ncbi:hypothetical protein QJS10_CPB18g00398 [Acorus calamus]|uniref:Uncharacterized protein n=1 Tax=Acorus calamus TaxID=4465 RepID=A0AAV9CMC6_ACOCL|nr:hypothetical protein QJS10_CPB18g00398 [Acorus calamus]